MEPCIQLGVKFLTPNYFFDIVTAIFAAVSNEVPCMVYQG